MSEDLRFDPTSPRRHRSSSFGTGCGLGMGFAFGGLLMIGLLCGGLFLGFVYLSHVGHQAMVERERREDAQKQAAFNAAAKKLKPGDTDDRVRLILGEPDRVQMLNGNRVWHYGAWRFVFQNGKIEEIVHP